MKPALLKTLWLFPGVFLMTSRAVQAVPSAAREWNEQTLSAIRLNVPNPPAHARNLFHTAVAMYDAWAAYDPTAVGYLVNEKISPLPPDVESARREAVSYAAYRMLRSRFFTSDGTNGWSVTEGSLDSQLTAMGYSPTVGKAPVTTATTPAELGKRIGAAVLAWGAGDGFSNTTYPQPYNTSVNPNTLPARAMSVLGNNGRFPTEANMPLGVGIPLIADLDHFYQVDTDPNFWQPLALSTFVSQNGIPTPGGIQTFVGVQSLATTPFSLTRTDPLKPWMDPFGGPSRLSRPGAPSATDAGYRAAVLDVLGFSAKLNDPTVIDISPGTVGNNALGTDNGTGRALNPVTGLPYTPTLVKQGDFGRVLAEFWADGPHSETPPGHWHVLANEVSDNPLTVKKIRGTGPTVNDLEWDVKTYFAVSAATHDAACAAWALKRYYSGPRPITMIRYMAARGQSTQTTDPLTGLPDPTYHPEGLPLIPGLIEQVTDDTAPPGQRHEQIWDVYTRAFISGYNIVGQIVVRSWPGEAFGNPAPPGIATIQSQVTWMRAADWLPFQRKTFNTPAFPGYVSGHSTFSRSSAEVLTLLTGSPYFPGGLGHHTFAVNSMQIDRGPSAPVDLQWCTYYDAADQAGQSRRWGGIHPSEDDYHGRVIGSQVGQSAFALAEKYWTGAIQEEDIKPVLTRASNGAVTLTWKQIRGCYHRVQSSADLVSWFTEPTSPNAYAYTPGDGTWTDPAPAPPAKFYRVVRSGATNP